MSHSKSRSLSLSGRHPAGLDHKAVPTESAPWQSVFGQIFDVVVIGAGAIGFAAARELAATGRKVLLVESSGALLWEATRAQDNRNKVSNTRGASTRWEDWLGELAKRQGAETGFFDGALAEVLAAHELRQAFPRLTTLFLSVPVAVEKNGDNLTAVIVATKAGLRRVYGRQWIDTTENGVVARLLNPRLEAVRRQPVALLRTVVIQLFPEVEQLEEKVLALATDWPGLELRFSVRPNERRLVWHARGAWHREVTDLVRALRYAVGVGDQRLMVTHCGIREFPVYHDMDADSVSSVANLLLLSPSFARGGLACIGDRFSLGASCFKNIELLPEASPVIREQPSEPAWPDDSGKLTSEVVVAGSGTAGAIAALAAASNGASVLALDAAELPGGIGALGGINGYCAGAEGGLQSELDHRTAEMNHLLEGAEGHAGRWHHNARSLALLDWFEQERIRFVGGQMLWGALRNADGRLVKAVFTASEEGVFSVSAEAFIDSTGDGDLAATAGAEFSQGRGGDGRTLSYSQASFFVVEDANGRRVNWKNYDAGWVDATDPEDISRAMLEGRSQYLRDVWTQPDRPLQLAPLLGLRQTRQILTDRNVRFSDMIEHARFEDAVGVARTILDTHSVDFEFEDDEVAFYYWGCRSFMFRARSELPYRMLLPRNLDNVWIACRAAGMENGAAYGLRMQRDMHRLGEAAGVASALAVSARVDSRQIDFESLRTKLQASGAYTGADMLPQDGPAAISDPVGRLERGEPGVHLWWIYRHPERFRSVVETTLDSSNESASFQAASILAMWNCRKAEPRLLRALACLEEGPPATPESGGAYGQEIDIPYWLQAVFLLRRCGSAACLSALKELAARSGQLLNIRTMIALTVERLARSEHGLPRDEALDVLSLLLRDPLPDPLLNPNRSLWRTLRGEEQIVLQCPSGVDLRHDHTWQLHLSVVKARQALGVEPHAEAAQYRADERFYVRKAFATIGSTPCDVPRMVKKETKVR